MAWTLTPPSALPYRTSSGRHKIFHPDTNKKPATPNTVHNNPVFVSGTINTVCASYLHTSDNGHKYDASATIIWPKTPVSAKVVQPPNKSRLRWKILPRGPPPFVPSNKLLTPQHGRDWTGLTSSLPRRLLGSLVLLDTPLDLVPALGRGDVLHAHVNLLRDDSPVNLTG